MDRVRKTKRETYTWDQINTALISCGFPASRIARISSVLTKVKRSGPQVMYMGQLVLVSELEAVMKEARRYKPDFSNGLRRKKEAKERIEHC